jgi:hypothetical protein
MCELGHGQYLEPEMPSLAAVVNPTPTPAGQKRIRERAAANFVVLLKDWTLFEQQFLQRPLPRTFFAGFATFLIDFG